MGPLTPIQPIPPHHPPGKPSGGYSLGYWKSREHTALENISMEVGTILHKPPGITGALELHLHNISELARAAEGPDPCMATSSGDSARHLHPGLGAQRP